MDFDSIIIGGGTVGLLTALVLAAENYTVAIVDRSDFDLANLNGPQGEARTLALSEASIRLLKRIDVWEALAPFACPIERMQVVDAAPPASGQSPHPRARLDFTHADKGQMSLGMVIESHHLNELLLRRALGEGGVTLFPDSVAHLTSGTAMKANGAAAGTRQVHLRSGGGLKTLKAPLVIAADGTASPSRAAAKIKYLRHAYKQSAIIALLGHDSSHENEAWQDFLPHGPCALLPLLRGASSPLHRSALVWTLTEKTVSPVMELDDNAFCALLSRHSSRDLGEIVLLSRRQTFPLSFLVASRFYAERLVLVGDAAHTIHPLAGQGFNLAVKDIAALRDVVVAARYAGSDIGHGSVLEHYDRWRRADVLTMGGLTHGLNMVFSIDKMPARISLGGPAAALRRAGIGMLNKSAPLKALALREAGGRTGRLPSLLQ